MLTRFAQRRPRDALARLGAFVVVVVVLVGALVLWLIEPMVVQKVRLAQFDQFQRWQPRPFTAVGVTIVDIDEASLKELGQWPWPRTRLAELVTRLREFGVKTIVFDVLLTESDRTAPQALAGVWNNPQVTELLATLPDPDRALAHTMHQASVVLGSSMQRSSAGLGVGAVATPALPFRVVTAGSGNMVSAIDDFDSVLWPLPLLVDSAAGIGVLNASPDFDGVVRRVPLFVRNGDQLLPSLSLEALRVAQGERNYVVRGDHNGVSDVRLGARSLPATAQGGSWLHYTLEQPQRMVSARAVLNANLSPGALQGHIVLVGSSAAGLMDLWNTPMGYAIPGVVAHAQALEQMILHHDLVRPAWAPPVEMLVLVLGSIFVGGVALTRSARLSGAVFFAGLLLLGAAAWYAYMAHRLLLDASNPAVAMFVVFGVASGIHHWSIERQQRWLRTAFSRYVSPNRVQHLLDNPEQLHLGGQRQTCSFVFTDLVGFTPMMESYEPEQVVSLLNAYLEAMLVIVFKHEGTLDRFVGDAIVVLFSAPVYQADHRQRAMDCALEIDVFATDYASRLHAGGIRWGLTRIGVHCGEVIVGNFGGKSLFDYRALGDPINTAARLESANKYLGTRMCVSQDIVDGCVGVPVRAVGRLVLQGKTQPLQGFVPEASLESADCAPAADYAAAIALLVPGPTQDADKARTALAQLARRYPKDPLVQLHLERLVQGCTDDLIVLTSK